MRPSVERMLEVGAVHLMTRVAPALEDGYEQSSAGVLGVLLLSVREEFERACARRVEENRALRALFDQAAPSVRDNELRQRLQQASGGNDPSLLVADLERGNAELRSLLIELHTYVEADASPEARSIEAAIWRELSLSTERRRLSMGVF